MDPCSAECRPLRTCQRRSAGRSSLFCAKARSDRNNQRSVEDGFLALCPELDIASQGPSIEEVRANLIEALALFFETADPSEVA
jgi:hypothetical protein